LPKGCSGIRKKLNRLQRELEAAKREAVGADHGELTGQDRRLIALALLHERRRLLASWWLTTQADAGTLPADQFGALLRLEAEALDRRMKAEAELLNPEPPERALPWAVPWRPGPLAGGAGGPGVGSPGPGVPDATAGPLDAFPAGFLEGAGDAGSDLAEK
jgi:hypothetical protein